MYIKSISVSPDVHYGVMLSLILSLSKEGSMLLGSDWLVYYQSPFDRLRVTTACRAATS
jgi:hypothetical protein